MWYTWQFVYVSIAQKTDAIALAVFEKFLFKITCQNKWNILLVLLHFCSTAEQLIVETQRSSLPVLQNMWRGARWDLEITSYYKRYKKNPVYEYIKPWQQNKNVNYIYLQWLNCVPVVLFKTIFDRKSLIEQ